jgi:hypothetical protein
MPARAPRAPVGEEWSLEQFAATLLRMKFDSRHRRDSHGGQGRVPAVAMSRTQ